MAEQTRTATPGPPATDLTLPPVIDVTRVGSPPSLSSSQRAAHTVPSRLMCPHCNAGLPPGWTPNRAGRCPTCRLIVGAHRAAIADGARDEPSGSAAGLLANAARRADVPRGDPGRVLAALHAAAADSDMSVTRLRMLDYNTFVQRHPAAPTLAVVLATFTTWKKARARSALDERRPGGRDHTIASDAPDDAASAQATG